MSAENNPSSESDKEKIRVAEMLLSAELKLASTLATEGKKKQAKWATDEAEKHQAVIHKGKKP